MTAAGAQRWAGLDLVRATAMLLGLAYHGVFAYLPGIGPYYVVQDPATQGALASLGATLHAFRMEVFFTLAGFFAHLLLERRGVNGFLRDRARRLLVPFTVALPLSIVADVMLRRWSSARGTLSPAYQPPLDALRLAPLHLWFLEYVFLFCAATWLLVRLFGQPKRQWTLRAPELLLLLALPTAWGLVLAPEPRPDLTFVPVPAALGHHGVFFATGFALYGARASLHVLRRCWPMLPVGLALAVVVFTNHVQWEPTGYALRGLVAWLVTLGALGLAFRFTPRERPWLTLLVDSSYWVYLVHYPVVVALQVALTPLGWPAVAKYAVVVVGSLALTLLSFIVFVRRSALAPWLGVRVGRGRDARRSSEP